MGKGSTIIKKLNPEKKYYNSRLDDERFPDKNFVIVPLYGFGDDDRFFYLTRKEEGLEIMGEFYIVDNKEALSFCRERTKNVEIKFHVTDPQGVSLSKEEAEAFLKKELGSKYLTSYLHNGQIKSS